MQIGMIGLGRIGSNMARRHGVHYMDVGTRGGVACLEHGYCLMIGGEQEVVRQLDPLFASRDAADYANRVLSAMRKQFGGHDEKKAER